MMKTIYDRNPNAWDLIEKTGRKNLATMAKHFTRCTDMDRALDYNSASSKWTRGFLPSPRSERLAQAWVQNNLKNTVPNPQSKLELVQPKRQSSTTLMVECPGEIASKVQRVLTMMGCEVIEI